MKCIYIFLHKKLGFPNKGENMKEYKTAKATIRIHGTENRERLKVATERFLKEVRGRKKHG